MTEQTKLKRLAVKKWLAQTNTYYDSYYIFILYVQFHTWKIIRNKLNNFIILVTNWASLFEPTRQCQETRK